MSCFDVFNGDADGLCALQQLRLEDPRDSVLVTGVKRDIGLLARVEAQAGDEIWALDIALEKNRADLDRLLASGARVRYFDHHFPGEIPTHPLLDTHIDTTPDRGTSLLVDDFLVGSQRAWAVVGTFGDNFDESARRAAQPLGLTGSQLDALRDLGIYLNYNGYGAEVADLHLPPDALFRRLQPYANPLDFIHLDPAFGQLRDGFDEDMARARAITPEIDGPGHRLHLLPAAPWARRAGGVLANELARSAPDQAHALLTRLPAGGFVVSVRAPLSNRLGADDLCRRFPGGGGRPAAAGINQLDDSDYDAFVAAFLAAF